jgi:hypothetical protein
MADFVVATIDDELDPTDINPVTVDPSDLSLREALALANSDAGHDTITFAATLAGQTIALSLGELVLLSAVTIDGDVNGDNAADITISGNEAVRVFNLVGGAATLDALTITNGFAGDFGGAVFIGSGGDVTILHSTLAGNLANASGGAIFNDGTATIVNTTISGNTAQGTGGGIANTGTLVLSNATLANNQATPIAAPATHVAAFVVSDFRGGGLYNSGVATLNNSTVTGNYADYGGGIFAAPSGGSSPLTLNNTIVAGNAAFSGRDLYVHPSVTGPVYLGVNVFSQAGVGQGTDIFEPNLANIFAAIDPVNGGGLLADNGGPVATVAIAVNGRAHDNGDNASLVDDTEDLDGDTDTSEDLPFDARFRDRVFDGTVDIGAFEINEGPPSGGTAGTVTYFEDDAPQALDDALTVSDPSGFLTGARIAITSNFTAGQDVLGFTNQNGITGSFDAATGVLTLAGLASDTRYQAALRSVTYANTSQNPSNAARTVNFQIDDGGGLVDIGNVGVNVIPLLDPPNDINGDHTTDIVWRESSGTVALWAMQGGDVLSNQGIATLSTDWRIVDADGDFDGDGRSDLLWQDDTGVIVLWTMDGPTILTNTAIAATTIGPIPDHWRIADTGDFTGDGRADVLWRETSGRVVLWEMNGATIVTNTSVADVPVTSQIEDTADFTGDGMNDILWHDQDGTVRVWEMNGATVVSDTTVGTLGDHWNVEGTGDFNADSRFDILWRNTSGTVVLWEMDGASIIGNTTLGTLPDNWFIADTGDYTGDANSDILWRDTSGTIALWEMNGPTIVDNTAVNTIPTHWQVVG